MGARLQTVVETPAYLSAAKGILSDIERTEVVNIVAKNPLAGVSIGGGIRKMRLARSGRGKSGGARVVFIFADEDTPVFLLTVFAKNEKTNLTVGERAALIISAKKIIASYKSHK
ncbi:MAG: type II toxin-antitoxin system RelE/ParE family toxin [Gammaproteobacteria bacterium]|nr:type II toxin-antitoxin system RelE/ParE family toxin [Gammaproteobacteria bacterium]MCY4337821.1 type II toxin-antitoxin system RelE/ParE family toxin [Gammaproteobacteria bacterium]